jgi:NAD(P)-dependent dehydrogenase (short-subunit alcohol dehydrogenase family)
MKLLEGKTAIVTGAGSGIGKAIALLYAKEGARVVVSDIMETTAAETAGEIKSGGGVAIVVKADTGNADDCKNLVDQAVRELGGLHIAVNNAGIAGPIQPLGEYPIEGWEKVISVNLSGVFYCMRYQIPAMLASGGGSIVNISSILGKVASKGSAAYVSAKHGVVGLTEAAALEYADQKIRVNSIGPGYILTPMLTNNLDEATMKSVAGLHPMGRLGTAEEVAELALWLNSNKASFVTGSYYSIDGGYLIQ